jgi:putative spermidine/putrescine transport system permease protein
MVPFGAYVTLGLLIPLIAVAVGAFQDNSGGFTFSNVSAATHGIYLHGFWQSIILSVFTSVLPAIFGLLIAYAIFTAKRGNVLRQVTVTASGVFANFGGVPLAFLFIASLGSTGLITHWLANIGLNLYGHGFTLYSLTGVIVVYLYFQIPLMVLVFLPAIDGLKVQWREASENLGASAWQYWRYVGGPLLMPAFLGASLLLFANALSAFATIQAWENQIAYIVPQQISTALSSEVGLSNVNVADLLALGMVVMVAIVMTGYALLQRRAARWLR